MSQQSGPPGDPWGQPARSWDSAAWPGDPGSRQQPAPHHQPSAPQQPTGQQPTAQQGSYPAASYPPPSYPPPSYPPPSGPAPQGFPPPQPQPGPSAGTEPDILVVTTDVVAGRRLGRSLGPVIGVSARSREIGRKEDPLVAYPALLERSRLEAIARMAEQARRIGADAVVGLRFDSSELTQTLSEVIAYGTAVTLDRGPG